MLTFEEKEKLVEEDKYDFEELFLDAVDSWFASDIVCCDNCINDFLEKWPVSYYADKAIFQRNSISLDIFYSGSCLQDLYTEAEFFRFVRLIECPRCGEEITFNFYPYDFPFYVSEDFEDKINELAEISYNTPFLLLQHPLAAEIFDAIVSLGKKTKPSHLTSSLFRARASVGVKKINVCDFDVPPAEYVKEGRYNHAGMGVFYLGSDYKTCYVEMRRKSCYIGEIEIINKMKILDLVNADDSHDEYSDLLGTIAYSALLSARQEDNGWSKPKYVFSRFISDCAKFAGFDAIQYPSTRMLENNYNLVCLNDDFSIAKGAKLLNVVLYNNDKSIQSIDITNCKIK